MSSKRMGFGKALGASFLYIVGAIILWFALAFIVIGPFFTQLFGELVYFGRDRVWMYGVIVIIGSFLFLFIINHLVIGQIAKTRKG